MRRPPAIQTFRATLVLLLGSLACACSAVVSTDGLSGGSASNLGGEQPASSAPDAGDSGVALPHPVPPPTSGDSGSATPPPASDAGIGTADAGSPPPPPNDAAPPPSDAGSTVDAADTAPPTVCSLGLARVFVTSAMYSGNLGGLSGADRACQTSADAQSLGGNWHAWLSTSSAFATSHIYGAKKGWVLLDGSLVAASPQALVSGGLAHAIDVSELGTQVTDGQTEVWTGIDVTGAMGSGFCTDNSGADWSSSSTSASTPLVGHLDATDSTWTAAYLQVCNRTNVRLYCFEQCP